MSEFYDYHYFTNLAHYMEYNQFIPVPFYEQLATILPSNILKPVVVQNQRSYGNRYFDFTIRSELSVILGESKKLKSEYFRFRIIVRFSKNNELYELHNKKYINDLFPIHLKIDVNNRKVDLPDFLPNDRTGKDGRRHAKPIDVTDHVIDNPLISNRIQIAWSQDKGSQQSYFFAIFLMRMKTFDELTNELLLNNVVTLKNTLVFISSQVKRDEQSSSREALKSSSSGNDDDIMEVARNTSVRLSCPISRCRIRIPVRGQLCQHLQCFDAISYLAINFKKPTWTCPICDKIIHFSMLVVDSFTYNILQDPNSNSLECITFDEDGSWYNDKPTILQSANLPHYPIGNYSDSIITPQINQISISLGLPMSRPTVDKYMQLMQKASPQSNIRTKSVSKESCINMVAPPQHSQIQSRLHNSVNQFQLAPVLPKTRMPISIPIPQCAVVQPLSRPQLNTTTSQDPKSQSHQPNHIIHHNPTQLSSPFVSPDKSQPPSLISADKLSAHPIYNTLDELEPPPPSLMAAPTVQNHQNNSQQQFELEKQRMLDKELLKQKQRQLHEEQEQERIRQEKLEKEQMKLELLEKQRQNRMMKENEEILAQQKRDYERIQAELIEKQKHDTIMKENQQKEYVELQKKDVERRRIAENQLRQRQMELLRQKQARNLLQQNQQFKQNEPTISNDFNERDTIELLPENIQDDFVQSEEERQNQLEREKQRQELQRMHEEQIEKERLKQLQKKQLNQEMEEKLQKLENEFYKDTPDSNNNASGKTEQPSSNSNAMPTTPLDELEMELARMSEEIINEPSKSSELDKQIEDILSSCLQANDEALSLDDSINMNVKRIGSCNATKRKKQQSQSTPQSDKRIGILEKMTQQYLPEFNESTENKRQRCSNSNDISEPIVISDDDENELGDNSNVTCMSNEGHNNILTNSCSQSLFNSSPSSLTPKHAAINPYNPTNHISPSIINYQNPYSSILQHKQLPILSNNQAIILMQQQQQNQSQLLRQQSASCNSSIDTPSPRSSTSSTQNNSITAPPSTTAAAPSTNIYNSQQLSVLQTLQNKALSALSNKYSNPVSQQSQPSAVTQQTPPFSENVTGNNLHQQQLQCQIQQSQNNQIPNVSLPQRYINPHQPSQLSTNYHTSMDSSYQPEFKPQILSKSNKTASKPRKKTTKSNTISYPPNPPPSYHQNDNSNSFQFMTSLPNQYSTQSSLVQLSPTSNQIQMFTLNNPCNNPQFLNKQNTNFQYNMIVENPNQYLPILNQNLCNNPPPQPQPRPPPPPQQQQPKLQTMVSSRPPIQFQQQPLMTNSYPGHFLQQQDTRFLYQ